MNHLKREIVAFNLQLLYNRIIITRCVNISMLQACNCYICVRVCVKVKEAEKDNENLCNVPVDGEL